MTAVNKLLMMAAKVCVLVVLFAVLYTISMRMLTGQSPNWSFDLSTIMMLPLTYLVAGPVMRERGHVSIDLVIEMIGGRVGKVLETAGAVVTAAFFSFLSFHAVVRFIDIYGSGQVTGSARLTIWPAALAVPLGMIAMAVVLWIQVAETARHTSVESA